MGTNQVNWDRILDRMLSSVPATEQPRLSFLNDNSFSLSSVNFSDSSLNFSCEKNCSTPLSSNCIITNESPPIKSSNGEISDSSIQRTPLANRSINKLQQSTIDKNTSKNSKHQLSNLTISAAVNDSFKTRQTNEKSFTLIKSVEKNPQNDGLSFHNSTKRNITLTENIDLSIDGFGDGFSKKPRPSNIQFNRTVTKVNNESAFSKLILDNDSPYSSPLTPNVVRNLTRQQISVYCMTHMNTFYQSNLTKSVEKCRRNDSQVVNLSNRAGSIQLFDGDCQKIYEDTHDEVITTDENRSPIRLTTEIVSVHEESENSENEQGENYKVKLIGSNSFVDDKEKLPENEIQSEIESNQYEIEKSIDEFELKNNATAELQSVYDEKIDPDEPDVLDHDNEKKSSLMSEHESYEEEQLSAMDPDEPEVFDHDNEKESSIMSEHESYGEEQLSAMDPDEPEVFDHDNEKESSLMSEHESYGEQMSAMDPDEPEVFDHDNEKESSLMSEHESYGESNDSFNFQPELSPSKNQSSFTNTKNVKNCFLNQTFDLPNKLTMNNEKSSAPFSIVNGYKGERKSLSFSKKKMNLLVPYDLNSTEEDTSFRRTITHRRSIDSNSYNKSRHIDDDRNNICISDVSSNANDHLMESSLSPIHVNNDSDVEFNESVYNRSEHDERDSNNHFLANLSPDIEHPKEHNKDDTLSSVKSSGHKSLGDSTSELIITRQKKKKRPNHLDLMLKNGKSNDNISPVDYDNYLRRSQRNRIQPLDYWRGQRPIYKMENRKINNQIVTMPTVVGVAKPLRPLIKQRRANTKSNQRKTHDDKVDNHHEHHCAERQTSSNGGQKFYDILNLSIHSKKFKTKSITDCPEFVKSYSGLIFKPSDKSKGIHTALIEKDDRGTAFGMIRFEPLAMKKLGRNGPYATYFTVIYGTLILKVNDENETVVKTGSHFKIFPKAQYYIKNVRKDEALIQFSVIREQSSN
ncbi:hypothetical protein DERP_000169 [Dermatophagoides pteronyssinus]|uniref:Mif2/CENP-C cupin domain-containing protein n=2 Tax=Dermatophagoides pteronyssinus TaxID=6956 RepID=A0ABQ8IZD4_DERPT|nr:hypothetical protein DERP_000169 [Dermatophagoides pteronyssinus]